MQSCVHVAFYHLSTPFCRSVFESGCPPADLSSEPWVSQDAHCVSALAKQFFRELPSPLVSAADPAALAGAAAAAEGNSDSREALHHFRRALYRLPRAEYR